MHAAADDHDVVTILEVVRLPHFGSAEYGARSAERGVRSAEWLVHFLVQLDQIWIRRTSVSGGVAGSDQRDGPDVQRRGHPLSLLTPPPVGSLLKMIAATDSVNQQMT